MAKCLIHIEKLDHWVMGVLAFLEIVKLFVSVYIPPTEFYFIS